MKLQPSKPSNLTCLDHVGKKKSAAAQMLIQEEVRIRNLPAVGFVANDDAIRVISCCHHITKAFSTY